MTQAMMSAVEAFIRGSPETWFCNKSRWRKRAKPQPAKKRAKKDITVEIS